jgi:hypothetical protein
MKVLSTLWSRLKGVWRHFTKDKTSIDGLPDGIVVARPFKVGDIVVYKDPAISVFGGVIHPHSLHIIVGLYPVPVGLADDEHVIEFILTSKYPLMPLHPSRFKHADDLSELERLLVH